MEPSAKPHCPVANALMAAIASDHCPLMQLAVFSQIRPVTVSVRVPFLLSIQRGSGNGTLYTYDLVGKVLQVNDPTGTYGFAYDNMGRLISTTTQYAFLSGSTFTNSYTYDAASNRTSLTAPDGSISTYGYDTLNRLNGLANSWAGSFGFAYDALGRRTQLMRPNGVKTNYSYDSLSHLLSVLHQAGVNTLDGASYTYDPAGNRTAKTNYLNATTSNYAYDALYELTQVTQGASTTESYSYDAVGNRLSSSGVPNYSYNSSNELTSNSTGSYTYDANGNTLSDASGKSYTWDFENRLVSAVVPGTNGGTTTFKYDPFGHRIQKSGPLGTTNYLYSGPDILEEVDNGGNVLARYTRAKKIDETLATLGSGTTSYYQADGLGSVTSLSDGGGALANTYIYDSFGKLTASTGTIGNPFQYTGREFDPETGIYEYRARYYDESVGRFISEDPIRFRGGINFYDYVRNDPPNLTDPNGLAPGGGGREICSYYDQHCKYGCNGSSSYECRAGNCCRAFPESPQANCTRECLISWDIANCSKMSGESQAACRIVAHLNCYSQCSFHPNPFKIPGVCWSIADGR
ncbi:MAG: RHS repeat-associated core domain-containing protein [Candidatus Sulfotelmatobacter sp.]